MSITPKAVTITVEVTYRLHESAIPDRCAIAPHGCAIGGRQSGCLSADLFLRDAANWLGSRALAIATGATSTSRQLEKGAPVFRIRPARRNKKCLCLGKA